MVGKKRTSADNADHNTRPSKAAKVSPTGKGKASTSAPNESKTTVPSAETFKEHALPLHIHLTHTPPTIAEPGSKEDATPNLSTDPGHIASLTMAPSTFSTGSFGWKASKRVAIELMNDEGKKEKVMVMFTANASVVGSKPESSKLKSSSGRRTRGSPKKHDEEEEAVEDDE